MNLLCPNCQKMLQVPEQYAGQLMKCPLCAGTFTVPALPTPPAPPPPPPAPTPPPPPAPAQTAPPPVNRQPDLAGTPAPAGSTAPAAGYTHTRSYSINPRALTWLAPACLVLVFVLTFFNWVGMYPGGVAGLTQNAWGAAFNSQSKDEVFNKNVKKMVDDGGSTTKELKFLTEDGPGEVAAWMIVFVLVLVLAVIVAVGGALTHLKMVPVQLPPSAEPLLSFRPLIVAGLSFLLLMFVVVQLLAGFPLENKVHSAVEKAADDGPTESIRKPSTAEDRQTRQMFVGAVEGAFNLHRTYAVTLSIVLLVIAVIGGLLEFAVLRRGNAPPPRIDIQY